MCDSVDKAEAWDAICKKGAVIKKQRARIEELEAVANAAQALIDDVKARHPGEPLFCPFMQAIEAALEQGEK